MIMISEYEKCRQPISIEVLPNLSPSAHYTSTIINRTRVYEINNKSLTRHSFAAMCVHNHSPNNTAYALKQHLLALSTGFALSYDPF